MGNVSFFETIMGRKYYESTIPSLVRQSERIVESIERVADGLIRIAKALEAQAPDKQTGCVIGCDPNCLIHGDGK